jgi:hypothetical protein
MGEMNIVSKCAHCIGEFTPNRKSKGGKNRGTYCSRKCAAHAPRNRDKGLFTPISTKAERVRANGLVNKRIKLGWMLRPTSCMWCDKSCKPDSHHPDYQQPDLVVWLCRSCHMKAHRNRFLEAQMAEKATRIQKEQPIAA